ncbi:unnamed protein product [Trichobilharzia regenti]|nr:unnamed protein product [Trichobilharzia regenti]
MAKMILSICICVCIAAVHADDVETPGNPNANIDVGSDTAPDGAIQDVKPAPQQGASLTDVVQNPLLGEQEESK